MIPDRDAALASVLHNLVTDVLTGLDAGSEDEVDPTALASMRRSVEWVLRQLPPDQLLFGTPDGNPNPAVLPTVVGLLVDIIWWLDSCDDDEVDPDTAVKFAENCAAELHALPAGQRGRLVEVLARLADTEPHPGKQHQLRFFPHAMGFIKDEPDTGDVPDLDDGDTPEWVRPEDRTAAR